MPEVGEHVVFNCPRFAALREEVEIDTGALFATENTIDHMLASKIT